MALGATIYNFDVELADTDRHVYESLALRVARHPSESEEYLVARLLAYLLEFTEGIGFRAGCPIPDEPAIAVRDLTGAITDVDRHRHARRRAAAQGVEGREAGRRLHPQGPDAVSEAAGGRTDSSAPARWSSTRSIARWSPRSSRASSGASPSACRSPTASCTCQSATHNLTGKVVRLSPAAK